MREDLKNEGRETAGAWMKLAIDEAADVDAMNDHLDILRAAAIHVLAADVYNRQRQMGKPAVMTIAEMAIMITEETNFYGSLDLVKVNTQDATRTPLQ